MLTSKIETPWVQIRLGVDYQDTTMGLSPVGICSYQLNKLDSLVATLARLPYLGRMAKIMILHLATPIASTYLHYP